MKKKEKSQFNLPMSVFLLLLAILTFIGTFKSGLFSAFILGAILIHIVHVVADSMK